MSGSSDICICPRCGYSECNLSCDWKPFALYEYSCPSCGLLITPKISIMKKEELEEYRADHEYEPWTREPTVEEIENTKKFDNIYGTGA